MSEWRLLRECGRFLSGGTPSTGNAQYWGGDIPWITASSLRSRELRFSRRRLTAAGLAAGSRLVAPGTLLFVVRGMSLKSEFRVGIATRPVAFGQDCKALLPAPGVDPNYLLHALQASSDEILGLVDEASHGTGRLQMSLLGAIRIRVPPLDEQHRIAEMLDSLDAAIEASRCRVEKLLSTDRGLVRDLVRGSAFTNGARRCRIGEFALVKRGASPRPIDNPAWFSDTGPGWVRIGDVTASEHRLRETRDRLSAAGASRSVRVSPGDVIMSIAATVGLAIVVDMDARIHDGFVLIDQDGTVDPDYLVLLLHHHRPDFVRQSQTGTQANINSEIVAQTEVVVPSRRRQLEVVEVVSSLRALLRAESNRLSKLRVLRAGVSRDLLSVQVRTAA